MEEFLLKLKLILIVVVNIENSIFERKMLNYIHEVQLLDHLDFWRMIHTFGDHSLYAIESAIENKLVGVVWLL